MSGPTDLVFPLVPRRRLIGLAFGAVHSARRGTGSDVAGSRPYEPGDDVDRIDWPASAKLSSARGSDEFVVREHYTDEAPRVVVVADRRPAMGLYPRESPWLSKHDAMIVAGNLIADSAAAARGLIGYLDYASAQSTDPAAEVPFWRPPHAKADFWRVKESHLLFPLFGAPEDNVERAFEHLAPLRRSLPPGSFVFVLSDFLSPPSDEAWARATELPWEIVPVVIQDPVWEQSFPEIASVVVPLVDPATGALKLARLSRREARQRRAANEARLEQVIGLLEGFGLSPVLLSTSDEQDVYTRFLEWAALRQEGARDSW